MRNLDGVKMALFNLGAAHGAQPIAQLLDKAPTTISHELKPPEGSSAKAGILDYLRAMVYFNDFKLLYSINEYCGHSAIRLPSTESTDASTLDIMAKTATLAKEFGESVAVIQAALSDQRISPNELRAFEQESQELMEALHMIRGAVRAKAELDAGRQGAVPMPLKVAG